MLHRKHPWAETSALSALFTLLSSCVGARSAVLLHASQINPVVSAIAISTFSQSGLFMGAVVGTTTMAVFSVNAKEATKSERFGVLFGATMLFAPIAFAHLNRVQIIPQDSPILQNVMKEPALQASTPS